MAAMARVRLGGYPAKQCARRIHNQYAPGTPEPIPTPPGVQAPWDAGAVFETEIVDEIRQLFGDSAQLMVLDDSDGWARNQQRTVAAMSSGAPVIAGGRLPDVNGRAGAGSSENPTSRR